MKNYRYICIFENESLIQQTSTCVFMYLFVLRVDTHCVFVSCFVLTRLTGFL